MGFFKKRISSEERVLEEAFEKTMSGIREEMNDLQKAAVGYGINMANSALVSQYSSLDSFSQLPAEEAAEFISKMGATWTRIINEGDGPTGMGFALFTFYLGAYGINGASRLTDKFEKELIPLSKMGDSLPS